VLCDTICLCECDSLKDSFLLLFAAYVFINLNYPAQIAEMLGIVHILCLKLDFPVKLRSAAFDSFSETQIFMCLCIQIVIFGRAGHDYINTFLDQHFWTLELQ